MMKQILYILLGIMLLSIVSCYDDEGNYDYHDINEVTFGEINTMYNVLLNIDTLKIDVGDFVEMSQGDLTDTDRFEYLWVIFSPSDSHVKDTISTDRVLSYPVTLAPGTYNLYLKIRDRVTDFLNTGSTRIIQSDNGSSHGHGFVHHLANFLS